MRTSELLAAVKGEFPNLTDKTLGDWVKDGFLQPPERVGMGTDGTPNEWAADSVHRIKVLKSVTSKRVDKSRARKALIAAGFFIGASALRDEMIKQIEEFGENFGCVYDDNRPDHVVMSDKAGDILMNEDLGAVITTSLLAPTFLYNKFYAALRDVGEDNPNITNRVHMPSATPLTKLLQVFSVYDIHEIITQVPDALLLDAFNDSTNSFNMVQPIIGWLVGYDEYPPLHDSCILARYVKRLDKPIKLERYEFEYLLRLVCIAGCLTIAARKDEIARLLPDAMTYILKHSLINADKKQLKDVDVDEIGDKMRVISDGVVSTNDRGTIKQFITNAHAEHVTFSQSLLK